MPSLGWLQEPRRPSTCPQGLPVPRLLSTPDRPICAPLCLQRGSERRHLCLWFKCQWKGEALGRSYCKWRAQLLSNRQELGWEGTAALGRLRPKSSHKIAKAEGSAAVESPGQEPWCMQTHANSAPSKVSFPFPFPPIPLVGWVTLNPQGSGCPRAIQNLNWRQAEMTLFCFGRSNPSTLQMLSKGPGAIQSLENNLLFLLEQKVRAQIPA